jgi:hypothetical protein
VKQVRDDGHIAKTTVAVKRTGTWRYHYDGDTISGASNSRGALVVVR